MKRSTFDEDEVISIVYKKKDENFVDKKIESEDEVEETPQVAKTIKMPKVKKESIKLNAN